MPITRLRRDVPAPARTEPTALEHDDAVEADRAGVDEMFGGQPIVCGYGTPEDLRGENAVFGLLGTPAAAGQITVQQSQRGQAPLGACDLQAASASGPDQGVKPDVIQALHDQYWRALDDPLASLAGDWSAHPTSADVSEEDAHRLPDESGTESVAGTALMCGGSLEALLSGARTLEDFFGPLSASPGRSDPPDWRVEPAPEILRLFAPPEYHAVALRRSPALPPVLARREHHALGIDSPLAVSGRLGRRTVWRESGHTGVIELGQKTWATSAGNMSLIELPAGEFGNGVTNRKPAPQDEADGQG